MARRHTSIGKRSVCAAVLLLAGCSQPLAPRFYDPGLVHEETGAFPVVEIGSFSAAGDADAQAFHRGFARALEQCNTAGGAQGRPIELQVLDDRGRPADTRTAVQRFCGPNGAVAIGCSSSAECVRAARAVAGAPAIVGAGNEATPEERGYAAGRRLVAACERAPRILPREVAAELAADSARSYPRAP